MTIRNAQRDQMPFRFSVEPSDVESFARALDISSAAVPVFFLVRALPRALTQVLERSPVRPRLRDVRHAEQDIRVHRRPRVGEETVVTASLEDEGDYGFQRAAVVRTSVRGPAGDGIADLLTTLTLGPATGRGRLARQPAPVGTGPVVAAWSTVVPGDLPSRYAEASGDHNPIHLSETAASEAALPGVVLHGMATLHLAVTGLADRVLGGDDARLDLIHARFARPVRPDDIVDFAVRGIAPEGPYTLDALVAGRPVLKDTWFTAGGAAT